MSQEEKNEAQPQMPPEIQSKQQEPVSATDKNSSLSKNMKGKGKRKGSAPPPPSPRRPTEETAIKLTPKLIIEKLDACYKQFVDLRLEIRELEKEFGRLDRKRNRWKATEEELQQRLEKKKELRRKSAEFNLLNLKIMKLLEAAQAKDMKPSDLPQEPPPLEDEEDPCLPDDILPRVIVCGMERAGKMADVPKIIVCVDDSCKKPQEEEKKVEEEGTDGNKPQPVKRG